jgi:hypothetical protein
VLQALQTLHLEPLDCPDASLQGATLAQILQWAIVRYF